MATYNKRGYKAPKPKDEAVENEFDQVEDIQDKNSATAEVFNKLDEGASRTEEWVAKNQKYIFGFVGAIAIAAAGYLLYNKFVVGPKEDDAANEMFQAQQYFQQAVDGQASDSLFALSLKGGEGKLGFLGITENYSGTKAANLSHYYAGMAYLNTGKYKEAVQQLEQFSSDDMMLKALALGGIGDAFSELDKKEDALTYYKKAAEANDNEFTTPRFLFKAGETALALNKKAEASKFFTQIKEKYEGAAEAANIDALIAMTE